MTDEETIRRDITAQIANKLTRWVRDAYSLYELIGLDENEAGGEIVLMMLKIIVRSLAKAMPKEKFLRTMATAYDCATADNEESDRRKQNASDR
jgi:hypothetical protein